MHDANHKVFIARHHDGELKEFIIGNEFKKKSQFCLQREIAREIVTKHLNRQTNLLQAYSIDNDVKLDEI